MVDDVHPEAQRFKLAFTPHLQRARSFAGGFELGECRAPAGQKDQAVGHAVHAGTREFRGDAIPTLYRLNQLILNAFLSHMTSRVQVVHVISLISL